VVDRVKLASHLLWSPSKLWLFFLTLCARMWEIPNNLGDARHWILFLTGRSHAHSGLTPTHRHLACILLLYCQCPVPVLLWQLWSGSAPYQICFRLTIRNPNPSPNPKNKNKEKQNDNGIKFYIELLNKYQCNMADRLRQLYHRYDWCEYFQFLHRVQLYYRAKFGHSRSNGT